MRAFPAAAVERAGAVVIALLCAPAVLLLVPTPHLPLVVASMATGALLAAVVRRVHPSRRTWTNALLAASYLLVVALLLKAEGRTYAAVGALVLAPVFWVAFTGAGAPARRAADETLAEVELVHRSLIAGLPDTLAGVFDRDLRCLSIEGELLHRLGYAPTDLVGRRLGEVLPAEQAAEIETHFRAGLEGHPQHFENRSSKAGVVHAMVVRPYRRDGETVGVFVVSRDVSVQRRAEAEAVRAQARFDHAFNAAPIGKALVSLDGRYLEVNSALCALVGRVHDDLIGMRWGELDHAEEAPEDHARKRALVAGDLDRFECEKRLTDALGHPVEVAVYASLVRDADGAPDHVVEQFVDVTERNRLETQLRHRADHDPLTGLRNRRRLEQDLQARLAADAGGPGVGALLLLDVDHFKRVNDEQGHAAGDDLLVAVALALRAHVRSSDLVARLGGDEFAVLVPDVDRDGAAHLAAHLLAQVRESAGLQGVRLSVGVAVVADVPQASYRTVLAAADRALYLAKNSGRDRHVVLEAEADAAPDAVLPSTDALPPYVSDSLPAHARS